jgi:tripartite-type tricarboxylate transporter receptor subunit TctC
MKMLSTIVTRLGCSLALVLLAAGAQCAFAQYPDKQVKIIVPFPPGGAADTFARLAAQKLTEAWGNKQQVVVDNRPGAGGIIGTEATAKSPPDGYTFEMVTIGHAVNPYMYSKLPYDTRTDLTPVAIIANVPSLVVVGPSFPGKTLKDLLAAARAKANDIQYASSGIGTTSHVGAALMESMTGVDMLHVPYKGAAPAVIATVAGEVPVIFSAYPSVLGQVKAGKLRALAVTSARRIGAAPTIPTVAEAALPGFESTQWWGLYGPAALPVEIVARLNREMNAILVTADTRKRLAAEGAEPAGGAPADLAAYHKTDYARWEKVIRSAGIKGE